MPENSVRCAQSVSRVAKRRNSFILKRMLKSTRKKENNVCAKRKELKQKTRNKTKMIKRNHVNILNKNRKKTTIGI